VKSPLRHRSVVAYTIEPERLRLHIPPACHLNTIFDANGLLLALLSVGTRFGSRAYKIKCLL
jgi:hypothetical protein